jgi:protein-tyrosine phosphatase
MPTLDWFKTATVFALMIDLHCHVIPGIDDGPQTVDESLRLCEAARDAGTETLIATPHVNWEYPDVDAIVIHTALAHLRSVLTETGMNIRVRPGAEMALTRIPNLSDAEIGVLRLGAGPYALVECPHHGGATIWIEGALRALADRGHQIVLAHPERSRSFLQHRWLVAKLIDQGMLSCITARSLIGDYGRSVRAYAWELLEAGLVHAIASDAHDVTRRPPDLLPALEAAGLEPGHIDYFIGEAPAAILAGDPVPAPPRVFRRPAGPSPHERRLARPRWLPARR